MRTYYCICGNKSESIPGKITECECGKVFGTSSSISNYINMRNTLSSTTKIEFNESTVAESVKKMGGSL